MKYDKFFELAKKAGIEECELAIKETTSLSFSLFHSEMDNYSFDNGLSVVARGLINGKFGMAVCDVYNAQKAEYLVNEIVKNAKIVEDDDPMFIYKGSDKYKKINPINKELAKVPTEEKIKKALELEKLVKEGDPRIIEVPAVEYSESESKVTLINSRGLKLSQSNNHYFIFAQAMAKEGEQTKSNYAFSFDNDFSKLDVKALAKEVIESVVSQLGGEPCESKNYKVVLDRAVVASLLAPYIGSADAEEVQKHTSLFIGKLNQKIASSKITIEDRPMQKTLFGRYFDDEGVATYNKPIIKNGVLKTYLYNLTTAAKDGVTTTGNAVRGAKMGVSPFFLYMKPGKKSLEELFKEIGDGVYITNVSGLHAGLDAQSGNFSLQSTGFLVKDGKKDRPLDIITLSGNLMKLFADVSVVGSDSKVFAEGISAPSVIVKSLAVGGK